MNELLTLDDKETLNQAKNAVSTITDALDKSKAYYNALGASFVMNYLKENGLLKNEPVNLHSSAKMLVDFEIADIQLTNLHIDVRVVFDENEIFIPKKHFDYKFLPDIYLILKLDEDLRNGELLGFVEPGKINKRNSNDEYYFVNKTALTPISMLKDLILNSPDKVQYVFTEHAENSVEKLIMLYMDHDIEEIKLVKLLDYLKNSLIAREKLIEFENFERLSYMTLKEFKNLDIENNDFTKYIKTLVNFDEFSEFNHKDDLDNLFEEKQKTSGLFIDDEAESSTEADMESGVTESDEEQEIASGETADVVIEENIPVPDEFDAFEEEDEFDKKDEFSFDEDVTLPEEEISIDEDSVSEESIIEEELPTDDNVEEISVETEMTDVDVSAEGEEISSVTESESIADSEVTAIDEELPTAEELLEPVTSRDMEFQVEGLDDLSAEESFEADDAVVVEQPEELVTSEEVVVQDESDIVQEESSDLEEPDVLEEVIEQPEDLNLNLAEPELSIEEENQDDLTLPDDVEAVEESQELENEEIISIQEENENREFENNIQIHDADDLSFDETESFSDEEVSIEEGLSLVDEPVELNFFDEPEVNEEIVSKEEPITSEDSEVEKIVDLNEESELVEEPKPLEEPENTVLETVSDDEVNRAIAGSVNEEDENSSLENDLTLEELLNDESNLGNEEAAGDLSNFRIDEDMETAPVSQDSQTEMEKLSDVDLDFMSQAGEDLDALSQENSETKEESVDGEQIELPEEVSPEDEGTDFAFAVDSKPVKSGKSPVVPILATVAVLGLAGAGAWYFISNNAKTSANDIAVDNTSNGSIGDFQLDAVNNNKNGTMPSAKPDDISNTKVQDVKLPVPANEQPEKTEPETLTIQKIKKDFSQPNTYLEVQKIVWDVPEYLTYNDDFNGYLQTLGSTLKLNLNGDLLLVNENVIFDKVRVKIGLKDSGKRYSAEIVDGCGTKSVDDLVLQSVKNTLNLLKPPVNSLDTADEDLYITIYL